MRPKRSNGVPYNGINVLLLWTSAIENGFESPLWMTYRQAAELGAHVRKGEHGSLVVYTSTFVPRGAGPDERPPPSGADEDGDFRDRRFLKAYTVFNVEQIEGLPDRYRAPPPTRFEGTIKRDQNAESFIRNTGATILYSGNRASYSHLSDRIKVPPIEAFRSAESFYSTTIHELGHWAQHPTRLSIDFGRKAWGDEGYAMAELFAELTACFVCADLELTPEPPTEHASYIACWLKILGNDKRAIFTAASTAQKAVDYLYALQPNFPCGSDIPADDGDVPSGP